MSIVFTTSPVYGDMDPVPLPVKVIKHQVHKSYTRSKKEFFKAPAEIGIIVQRISTETGVSYDDIEKVMWCESGYVPLSDHINNNGSIDKGLLQINSIHKSEGIKMGLDFYNPDDNATFAIYLIKQKIKRGRPPLEDWVCKP